MMRYHFCLGVGHTYAHTSATTTPQQSTSSKSDNDSDTQPHTNEPEDPVTVEEAGWVFGDDGEDSLDEECPEGGSSCRVSEGSLGSGVSDSSDDEIDVMEEMYG
jgi:hypothetical protein